MILIIVIILFILILVYERVTHASRLINSALKIYFSERSNGVLADEARRKVVEILVPPHNRERVILEYEGFERLSSNEINEELLNIENKIDEVEERKIKLLMLAICARQTESLVMPAQFLSYLSKINNIYKKVSKSYPQVISKSYPQANGSSSAVGKNLTAKFLNAASEGKLELLRELIDKGININARDDKGGTALMYATIKGNTSVVKKLLEDGADIDAKDFNGMTPLMFASYEGKIEVASVLVREGADIEAKDSKGTTALMYASYKGYPGIVKILIENGADVDAKDYKGTNVLMGASMSGDLEIAKMLLGEGVDVNAKDEQGATALMYAYSRRNMKIVKLLKVGGAKG